MDDTSTPVRGGSGEMFDAIAARYDTLNRIISLGIDQSWRRRTLQALELSPGQRVLDLATGTGDLAILIAESDPSLNVVGLDPSRGMLEVARKKLERLDLSARVSLRFGDAEQLPFEDDSFDAVSMAFGIRNVQHRERALREIARVTRRTGRVGILELSEPEHGVLGPLARFHVHTLVPWIGGLLSGAREYSYLQRSVAEFPAPAEFQRQLQDSGLDVLATHALAFGACQLFVSRPAS